MSNLIYATGDLITATDILVFCYQTNCFGTGLPRKLREAYPEVAKMDRQLHKLLGEDELFGTIRLTRTNDWRIFCGLYSRYGDRATDHAAFAKCLERLHGFALDNLPETSAIGFPYGIGAGYAGGDWSLIGKMLEAFAAQVPQKVYLINHQSAKRRVRSYGCK